MRLVPSIVVNLTKCCMLLKFTELYVLPAQLTSLRTRTTLFLVTLQTTTRKWILTVFAFNRSLKTHPQVLLKLTNRNSIPTKLALLLRMELTLQSMHTYIVRLLLVYVHHLVAMLAALDVPTAVSFVQVDLERRELFTTVLARF